MVPQCQSKDTHSPCAAGSGLQLCRCSGAPALLTAPAKIFARDFQRKQADSSLSSGCSLTAVVLRICPGTSSAWPRVTEEQILRQLSKHSPAKRWHGKWQQSDTPRQKTLTLFSVLDRPNSTTIPRDHSLRFQFVHPWNRDCGVCGWKNPKARTPGETAPNTPPTPSSEETFCTSYGFPSTAEGD